MPLALSQVFRLMEFAEVGFLRELEPAAEHDLRSFRARLLGEVQLMVVS